PRGKHRRRRAPGVAGARAPAGQSGEGVPLSGMQPRDPPRNRSRRGVARRRRGRPATLAHAVLAAVREESLNALRRLKVDLDRLLPAVRAVERLRTPTCLLPLATHDCAANAVSASSDSEFT